MTPPSGDSRAEAGAPTEVRGGTAGAPDGEPRATTRPARADVATGRLLSVELLSRRGYRRVLDWQRRLAREKIEGRLAEDLLLLVEHEPVVTMGRNADPAHLVADGAELERRGVDLVEIERGGDVTYHGPGQLVAYPILDLRRHRTDLHWYLRTLEGALIGALEELGLAAFRVSDHTGVWVGREASLEQRPPGAAILEGEVRKIASIGVHASRWITWHGVALNVTPEPLENFELLVPCGIDHVRMTSLAAEGVEATMERAAGALRQGFARAFGVDVREADGDLLDSLPDRQP